MFELAYVEYCTKKHHRNRFKREETNYSKFVLAARAFFNYSSTTPATDIWTSFLYKELTIPIKMKYNLIKKRKPAPKK